jgi:hypothetical protein
MSEIAGRYSSKGAWPEKLVIQDNGEGEYEGFYASVNILEQSVTRSEKVWAAGKFFYSGNNIVFEGKGWKRSYSSSAGPNERVNTDEYVGFEFKRDPNGELIRIRPFRGMPEEDRFKRTSAL